MGMFRDCLCERGSGGKMLEMAFISVEGTAMWFKANLNGRLISGVANIVTCTEITFGVEYIIHPIQDRKEPHKITSAFRSGAKI